MYNVSESCQIKNLNDIYVKFFGYPSKGFFVEVGAYDGEFVSNTSCLADHGWGGLYVEPINEFYLKCLDRHSSNDVIVANVAIGVEEKNVIIYKGDTLSTLDQAQVKRYNEIDVFSHITFEREMCFQTRLDTLMQSLGVPKAFDILVVDVEGKEPDIFESFELDEWQPKMLIVELEDEHPSFRPYRSAIDAMHKLRCFIIRKNYIEIYRDTINTVFIRKNFS